MVKGDVLLDTKDFAIQISYNSSPIPDCNLDCTKKGDLDVSNTEKTKKMEECQHRGKSSVKSLCFCCFCFVSDCDMVMVFEKVECKILYFRMQGPWGRNGIVF